MNYVDGFVATVPTANREIYRQHAATAAVVFQEYGALNVVECWGDVVPESKLTSSGWRSSARRTRRWCSRGDVAFTSGAR